MDARKWLRRGLALIFAVWLIVYSSVIVIRSPITRHERAFASVRIGDDQQRVDELFGGPARLRLSPDGSYSREYTAYPLLMSKDFRNRGRWRIHLDSSN